MSPQITQPLRLKSTATVWEYLALPDAELERVDVAALDFTVARGLEGFRSLEADPYLQFIDAWTSEFSRRLPASEAHFRDKEQARTKVDIRFYRVGMLQHFISHAMGMRYIEDQRRATLVFYANPGDLFLKGLIDTKRGTCANLATLHVAMARRMGWPVGLACVDGHKLSRYDDGEVAYNIECAFNELDGFSYGSDEKYLQKFGLSQRAVKCGSDLRKLTAREMIAIFLGHRARHYKDVGRLDLCDADCALARALFPNHRKTFVMGMLPYIQRGEQLFGPDEVGHPRTVARDLPRLLSPFSISTEYSQMLVGDRFVDIGRLPTRVVARPAAGKGPATVALEIPTTRARKENA